MSHSPSLKLNLLNLIREQGEVSYGSMCQFTVEEGYKVSTSERRLRELMHPKEGKAQIEPVWKTSKRNTQYIAAYRYKALPKPAPSFRILSPQEVAKQYQTLNL